MGFFPSTPLRLGCLQARDKPRLPRDVKNESSLLYTRQRDIHAVGIVLLQMLLGLDVTEKYSDIHMALESCASSLPLPLILKLTWCLIFYSHLAQIPAALAQHALNMILPSKKNHASCLTLLADLAQTAGRAAVGPQAPRTPAPVPISAGLVPGTPGPLFVKSEKSSPEAAGLLSYFQVPRQRVSRWKEDWEELEILVGPFFLHVRFGSLTLCW